MAAQGCGALGGAPHPSTAKAVGSAVRPGTSPGRRNRPRTNVLLAAIQFRLPDHLSIRSPILVQLRVEMRGLEPLTSALQKQRSPN